MALYFHDKLMAKTILRLIPDWVKPNHLTVLRFILTPLVVWTVWSEDFRLGIPLFLLVAFTDAMDGSLARVRNQVSEWGKVWDPVADKILVASVALVLMFRDFPEELTMAVIGLEAIFLVGGYFRKRQGRIVSANRWGKFKMLAQVVGLTLFMLSFSLGLPLLADASYAIFGLAIVFALASLFTQGI